MSRHGGETDQQASFWPGFRGDLEASFPGVGRCPQPAVPPKEGHLPGGHPEQTGGGRGAKEGTSRTLHTLRRENNSRVKEWRDKRWVGSSLLPVSGGPCTEGLGGEAGAREGGDDESRGGEQQLQQDGRGEAPDEDGSDQGEP